MANVHRKTLPIRARRRARDAGLPAETDAFFSAVGLVAGIMGSAADGATWIRRFVELPSFGSGASGLSDLDATAALRLGALGDEERAGRRFDPIEREVFSAAVTLA